MKTKSNMTVKDIIWYLDMICWLLSAIVLAIVWKPAVLVLLFIYSLDKKQL